MAADRPPVRFSEHNAEYAASPLLADKTWPDLKSRWFDAEFQVDYFTESIRGRTFHGETFPVFWPNLGPNVYTAFHGADLEYGEVTSWIRHCIHDWDDVARLKYRADPTDEDDRAAGGCLLIGGAPAERVGERSGVGHVSLSRPQAAAAAGESRRPAAASRHGWLGRATEAEPFDPGSATVDHRHGLSARYRHAVSEMVYALKPEFHRFVAVVGIDDEMRNHPQGSVVFEVWIDDRRAAQTPVMRVGDYAYVDVEIPAGSKRIRLVAGDAGDGINADHADWARAGFLPR